MSCNDTQSGLITKPEKFSYIEAKGADVQELSFQTSFVGGECWNVVQASDTLVTTAGERAFFVECTLGGTPTIIELSTADLLKPGRAISIIGSNGSNPFDVQTENPADLINNGIGAQTIFGGAARTFVVMPGGPAGPSGNAWYEVPQ
jgi:hypothetical protein